jgi:hypothetical protein
MEQTRQREEAAAAAAAAEAQPTKEELMTDRSGTQVHADLTQMSLTAKDDKLFNGKTN